MKKADRKKLNAALDMALAPPRKVQRQALDALLDEYDRSEETAAVEEVREPAPIVRAEATLVEEETPHQPVVSPAPLPPPVASPPAPYQQLPVRETPVAATPLPAPVSPQRDFAKVANSIARDALPNGLFKGNSKKLYDALYLRTRGALPPCRGVQARHSDLMQWAGVSLNTLRAHIRHLESVYLIKVIFARGDNQGAMYEVRLPEEILHLLPPPTTSYHLLPPPPTISSYHPSQDTQHAFQQQLTPIQIPPPTTSSYQNSSEILAPSPPTTSSYHLMYEPEITDIKPLIVTDEPPPTTSSYHLPPPPPTTSYLLPEIGRRRSTQLSDMDEVTATTRHNDDNHVCIDEDRVKNDDDDTHTLRVPGGAWALAHAFELTARSVCGELPDTEQERERWREVGNILGEELCRAAARTKTISSVPAFLAAHLRRQFGMQTEQTNAEATAKPTAKARQRTKRSKIAIPGSSSTPDEISNAASRYSFAECLRYAEYLQATGRGITNPGGLATTLHRTGLSDSLIARYLVQENQKNTPASQTGPQRFDQAEIHRQTEMAWKLLESETYTIAELETNFGLFLHPEDWQQIKSKLDELNAARAEKE